MKCPRSPNSTKQGYTQPRCCFNRQQKCNSTSWWWNYSLNLLPALHKITQSLTYQGTMTHMTGNATPKQRTPGQHTPNTIKQWCPNRGAVVSTAIQNSSTFQCGNYLPSMLPAHTSTKHQKSSMPPYGCCRVNGQSKRAVTHTTAILRWSQTYIVMPHQRCYTDSQQECYT